MLSDGRLYKGSSVHNQRQSLDVTHTEYSKNHKGNITWRLLDMSACCFIMSPSRYSLFPMCVTSEDRC